MPLACFETHIVVKSQRFSGTDNLGATRMSHHGSGEWMRRSWVEGSLAMLQTRCSSSVLVSAVENTVRILPSDLCWLFCKCSHFAECSIRVPGLNPSIQHVKLGTLGLTLSTECPDGLRSVSRVDASRLPHLTCSMPRLLGNRLAPIVNSPTP